MKKLFSENYGWLKLKCRIIKEKASVYEKILITNSNLAAKLLKPMRTCDKETFTIILLNAKNIVLGVHELYVGTINSIPISPRDLLKIVLLSNSNAAIIAHNHVSGDEKPSEEDIYTTKKLKEAFDLMGIKLCDHIIITMDSHYSFADNNLI